MFNTAGIGLLERFAQDTSQSPRKRESWARIAQLFDEMGSERNVQTDLVSTFSFIRRRYFAYVRLPVCSFV